MKKFAALLLALTMVLGMATITASAEGSERVITIGTTYDVYWESSRLGLSTRTLITPARWRTK